MAKKKRRRTNANALNSAEKDRLCLIGVSCTVGAVMLCGPRWTAWLGAVLFVAGIVNWMIAAFNTERIGMYEHEEFWVVIPAALILYMSSYGRATMDPRLMLLLAVVSLMISIPFVCADWHKRKRNVLVRYIGMPLLTFACVFIFMLPLIEKTNVNLDPHEPTVYEGTVIDTQRRSTGKSTVYTATVTFINEDGQPQQEELNIRRSQYQEMDVGQTVRVCKGEGLYGYSYWMIEAP